MYSSVLLLLLFLELPSLNAHTSCSLLHSNFTQEDSASYNTCESRCIDCYSSAYVMKRIVGKAEQQS